MVACLERLGHQPRHRQLSPRITFESNGIRIYRTFVNAAECCKVSSGIVTATQKDTYPAAVTNPPANGLTMQFAITPGVTLDIGMLVCHNLRITPECVVTPQVIAVLRFGKYMKLLACPQKCGAIHRTGSMRQKPALKKDAQ